MLHNLLLSYSVFGDFGDILVGQEPQNCCFFYF